MAAQPRTVRSGSVQRWIMGGIPQLVAVSFFLMLLVPTAFRIERAILLLVLVGFGIASARKWRVDMTVLAVWLSMELTGAFFVLWGLLHEAPGALRISSVFIGWPVIYMAFVGMAHRPSTVARMQKTIVLAVLASALMTLALVGAALVGGSHVAVQLLSFENASVTTGSGFPSASLLNLTTVIYGVPYLMGLSLAPFSGTTVSDRRWRAVTVLALLLSLLAAGVAGRRALWLLVAISPFLVFALLIAAGTRLRWRAAATVGVIVAVVLGSLLAGGVRPAAVSREFLRAFQFNSAQSAEIRKDQFLALVSEWRASPLLGYGLGASAKSYVRSAKMPWAYELSYVDLLFETGIAGVLLYSVATGWIFVAGIRIARRDRRSASMIVPLLAGLLGFLIVNATNPYLLKFDYLWTLFLPVAAINAYRTSRT